MSIKEVIDLFLWFFCDLKKIIFKHLKEVQLTISEIL